MGPILEEQCLKLQIQKITILLSLLFIPCLAFSLSYNELKNAPDESAQKLFSELTDSEQKSFFENKTLFLTHLEKALNIMKYTYGVGFITSDAVNFIKDKLSDPPPIPEEIRIMMETEGFVREPEQNLNLKERAMQFNNEILKTMDHHLWEHAPIVANANEFGFAGSIGFQALGGVGTKGWGGLIDMGFSITFNKQSKALALQLFRNKETYKSSLMKSVAAGGAMMKAGVTISRTDHNLTESAGGSFYPPMAPGYSSSTERTMMAGMSTGIPALFFPPSPIGDILTYSTDLDHKVFFRVEASHLYKGFLRFKIDLGIHATLMSLADAIKSITMGNRNKCDSILLNRR